METGKILKVCGSVIKKESLAFLTHSILANTTVAEASQPYANYYGQVPEKPKPNSLFLLTLNAYTLEETLRFTQNIDICSKNMVNAASAVIQSSKVWLPAIRIRNFPDYQNIKMLQECYQSQGIEFIKRSIHKKDPLIKVNKCFTLKDAGDGYFFDMDEENEGYFTVPWYPDISRFEALLRDVRNNSSCSLFDAAYGGFIINGKVIDMIRIYSGQMNLELLKCIRQETFKWIEIRNRTKQIQQVH